MCASFIIASCFFLFFSAFDILFRFYHRYWLFEFRSYILLKPFKSSNSIWDLENLCVSSSHRHPYAYVYAMNLKRKSFDCFFLNFVTFSHSVSRLTLFFSLLVTISAVVLVAHTTHISVKHFSVKQRSEINNWNLIFIKIERLFDMQ